MQMIYIVAVATALSVMFIASAQDIMDREVSDALWIAGGIVAIPLLFYSSYSQTHSVQSLLIPGLLAFLYADIYVDWNQLQGGNAVRYALGIMLGAGSLYSLQSLSPENILLASVVAWYFFIILLYRYDFIKGGADAKALIFLLFLFPTYPQPLVGSTAPYFLSVTFPFFLSALLIGSVATLSFPVFNLFRNLRRGDVAFPHIILGYRKPPARVDLKKEWLLEVPEGAARVRVKRLGELDEQQALARIRQLGWESTWVSPKIPFLVPVTVAIIFVLVFGNVLTLL